MKKILICLLMFILALSVVGCGSQTQQASEQEEKAKKESITITLPTWTGYGPLFLAQKKGFFAEEGLDVKLDVVQGLAERKQALAGNKVQGMATAQDVQVTLAASGIPIKVIWALDASYGGDGILAKKNINNVADLKGKKVALEVGSTSHLFLLTVLQKAGLTDKDIQIMQMTASDAGAAFVAGKVDAAVTWEPWLTKGSKEGNGKILVSTKDEPGIIIDTVCLRADLIKAKPHIASAFVRAMDKAMKYWAANPTVAEKIMAEGLGISQEEFKSTCEGLKFYDTKGNKEFFGTVDKPGAIYDTTQKAIDFYAEKKIIENKPNSADILDPTFVNEL